MDFRFWILDRAWASCLYVALRMLDARGKRQEAGGKRQEAGDRRQEARLEQLHICGWVNHDS